MGSEFVKGRYIELDRNLGKQSRVHFFSSRTVGIARTFPYIYSFSEIYAHCGRLGGHRGTRLSRNGRDWYCVIEIGTRMCN